MEYNQGRWWHTSEAIARNIHRSIRIEKTAVISDVLEIRFADMNTWFEVQHKSFTQIHVSSAIKDFRKIFPRPVE